MVGRLTQESPGAPQTSRQSRRQQPVHSMRFTAEPSSNGVVERDFIVGEVPGVLWSSVSDPDHAPLVLMGHGGGLHKKTPALVAVPEWQATLDALPQLPEIGEAPIGYGGRISLGTAIGVPLTAVELRITASPCSTPSPPRKVVARQPGRSSHHPTDRGRQRVPGSASRPARRVTGMTRPDFFGLRGRAGRVHRTMRQAKVQALVMARVQN